VGKGTIKTSETSVQLSDKTDRYGGNYRLEEKGRHWRCPQAGKESHPLEEEDSGKTGKRKGKSEKPRKKSAY